MKKILSLLVLTVLVVASCSKYDDSALLKRISDLEDNYRTLNSNVNQMSTTLNGLASSDVVTGVAPINEGGKVVGYTITFKNAGSITIMNGTDGAPGDSMFSSVTETTDTVIVTLADGTVYELPKEKRFLFTTASNYWPVFDNLEYFKTDTYDLNFTVEGAEGEMSLVVLSKTDVTTAEVNWNDDKNGGFIRVKSRYDGYITDDSFNYNRGDDVLTIIFTDDAGHCAVKTFYVPYMNLELMFSNNYDDDDEVDMRFNNQAHEEDLGAHFSVVFDNKYGDYDAVETFQISESEYKDYVKIYFQDNPFATLSYLGNFEAYYSKSYDYTYYYINCDYHYKIAKNTTGRDRSAHFDVDFNFPPLPPITNIRTLGFSHTIVQYK